MARTSERQLVDDGAFSERDPLDCATVQTEMDLAQALRRLRDRAPEIAPRGTCLFCEATVDPWERWCPADPEDPVEHSCCAMWEREQEAKRRS